MAVTQKQYAGGFEFAAEFHRVYDFLKRINEPFITEENFLWARWEWMFSRWRLDTKYLDRIGIWEDDGKIVGLATYEQSIGYAWFCIDPAYRYLHKEILCYANERLSQDGVVHALIRDTDAEFQDAAARLGFYPTQDKECNAVLPLDASSLSYTLPEGYRIVSLDEEYDLRKYNKVLHHGFNHPGEAPETEEWMNNRRRELSGPHNNLHLKVAVASPDGDFISYCGTWYLPGTQYALIEPVATVPEYRKKGMGRAAVLEAARRCAELGAKMAYVGSSQQFYYNLGFRPYSTYTWWKKNV